MILRVVFFLASLTVAVSLIPKCQNKDMNCYFWVADNPDKCETDKIISDECQKACHICGPEIEKEYDLKRIPKNLHKVAFLIGKWKSERGKADFPTIPRFTYGEELDIQVATTMKTPVLNYTAFAWDNGATDKLVELHSEHGFITGSSNSSLVALNTVMSNGFQTIEEGRESGNSIRFLLRRIGRINFSRDLPVVKMIREWTLLNETYLESSLYMATTTHPMMLHTQIIYKKIYP